MPNDYWQPTVVIVGADTEWVFALQRDLRALVGWEHDIVLTFSAEKVLRYARQRPVVLVVAADNLAYRPPEIAHLSQLARLVKESSARAQLLLVGDAAGAEGVDLVLGRQAGIGQIARSALGLLGLPAPAEDAPLSSAF